jgi:arginine decarboxylase
VSDEPTTAIPRPRRDVGARGLAIQVVSGIGFGPTELAAFDAALRAAGIANYNLIRLTSIIPAGSTVRAGNGPAVEPGTWGNRLYVVLADHRVHTRYEEAVAGLGWVQERETGRGLFVEHVGHTEREVRRDVLATLESMCEGRGESFGPPDLVVRATVCSGEPACALVAAVYEAAPWEGEPVIDLR